MKHVRYKYTSPLPGFITTTRPQILLNSFGIRQPFFQRRSPPKPPRYTDENDEEIDEDILESMFRADRIIFILSQDISRLLVSKNRGLELITTNETAAMYE